MAVTDLFVEKALAYLEVDADKYKSKGNWCHYIAFVVIGGSAVLAVKVMFAENTIDFNKQDAATLEVIYNFIKGFTAYGMIVLAAVGLWRFGKALLDQSERLLERRHALRQGRLFVHLNNGKLTIDELEKAFNWNVTQSNAFGNIQTEASAPWGNVTKDLAKITPEILKAGIETIKKRKEKNEEEKDKSK